MLSMDAPRSVTTGRSVPNNGTRCPSSTTGAPVRSPRSRRPSWAPLHRILGDHFRDRRCGTGSWAQASALSTLALASNEAADLHEPLVHRIAGHFDASGIEPGMGVDRLGRALLRTE